MCDNEETHSEEKKTESAEGSKYRCGNNAFEHFKRAVGDPLEILGRFMNTVHRVITEMSRAVPKPESEHHHEGEEPLALPHFRAAAQEFLKGTRIAVNSALDRLDAAASAKTKPSGDTQTKADV